MLALSVCVAALCAASASARLCTDAEEAKYKPVEDAIPAPCLSFLFSFKICTDECYIPMQNDAKLAPNCTRAGSDIPYLETATNLFARCENLRADSATKYFPKLTPNAPACSRDQSSSWDSKYGRLRSQFTECGSTASVDGTCSDDCLKLLETGVTEAPACRNYGTGNYTMNEYSKAKLVSCVLARGEALKTNKVVQTVAGLSSGSVSASETATTASASASLSMTKTTVGIVGAVTAALTLRPSFL